MALTMSGITLVLRAVGRGERKAPGELWSLVYDELRRLAAGERQAKLVTLGGADASTAADNTNPSPVLPQTSTRTVSAAFDCTIPENSLTIIRMPAK